MKARWKASPEMKTAVKDEVKKRVIETSRTYGDDLDSVCLWVLHSRFGFGKKRLRRFYETFSEVYEELLNHYELDIETPFVCRLWLKQIGVDVEEWNKQR